MIINFSPIRSDAPLVLHVSGDVLTLNGEPFDFSPLAAGEDLPVRAIGNSWFTGPPVTRTAGQIVLTLLLPIPAQPTEVQKDPHSVEVTDGPVELPR